MKILLTAVVLLAITLGESAANEVRSISGTIYSETPHGTWFRLKTTRLTADALYAAVGISTNDYTLHYNPDEDRFLEFRSRTNTNITIPVLQKAGDFRVLRNHPGTAMLELPLASGATAPPLLENFRGTAIGRLAAATPGHTAQVEFNIVGSTSSNIFKIHFKTVRISPPGD